MRPITEKVLQRLVFEKLILATQITPIRKKITLEEFLQAAEEEPRIYSALTAILLYKPQIFKNLFGDLKKHPEISKFVDELFLEKNPHAKLFGHDKAFYQKSARTFREYLEKSKLSQNTKDKVLSVRLYERDMDHLQKLTEKLGTRSYGETIRHLINQGIELMG